MLLTKIKIKHKRTIIKAENNLKNQKNICHKFKDKY